MNILLSSARNNNFQWSKRDPEFLKEQIQEAYNILVQKLQNIKTDNPLVFYGDLLADMQGAASVIGHLNNLLPGYTEVDQLAQELSTKLEVAAHTNEQLKKLVLDYQPTEQKLVRYKQLVEKKFRTHPEELINKFQKITVKFEENVKTDVKNRKLELNFNEELIAGLQPDFLKRIQQGEKIVLDASGSTTQNVMTYAQSDELREKYWRFQQDRCEDNVDLIEEMLNLKQKIAEFYEVKSIGEYNLKDRMVENASNLEDFLNKLHDAVLPAYKHEKEVLEKEFQNKLMPWNNVYLMDKLKTRETQFDMREFRPYFEYNGVLSRLWKFLEELYSVKIQYIEKPENTWHENVALLVVTGKDIVEAKIYIDLTERDDKRQGAYFMPISERVMVVVANFAPKTTPYLLEYDDINTLFHEFGHCFHYVMYRDQYVFQSGMEVPWDFVEVPSQFFENFLVDAESLRKMAVHYETGTAVPDALIEKLIKRKRFMNGHFMMRQLEFGWLDYNIHTKLDWQQFAPSANGFSRLDNYFAELLKTHRHDYGFQMKTIYRHFTHIFSSLQGYTCGYYSYFYADVIQAHLFAEFKKGLPFQKYVHEVLAVGNTRSPLQSVNAFCGGFGFDAFLYDYGLKD